MTRSINPKPCARSDCDKTFVPYQLAVEGKTGQGWVHENNGDSWCPLHRPSFQAQEKEFLDKLWGDIVKKQEKLFGD